MAEPGFDDHTQRFGAAPPPGLGAGGGFAAPGQPAATGHGAPTPYGHAAYGSGPLAGGPPAGSPLGDWLHEAGAAWSGAPPGYAAPGYPSGAPPSPWVAPPSLDADEPRGRWSLNAAAPWVVAGLLCAVLLTGRDAPAAGAGDVPLEVAATDAVSPDVTAQAPGAAGAPVEAAGAAPSCAAVSP